MTNHEREYGRCIKCGNRVNNSEDYTVAEEGYIHNHCLRKEKTALSPALLRKGTAAAAVVFVALGLALAGGYTDSGELHDTELQNTGYDIQIEYEVSEPTDSNQRIVTTRHITISPSKT